MEIVIIILMASILVTAVIGVIFLRAYLILIAKNQVGQIEEVKKMADKTPGDAK